MENKENKMNGYVCFYKSHRLEIYADSKYAAQCKACDILRIPYSKGYLVAIELAEKGGKAKLLYLGD